MDRKKQDAGRKALADLAPKFAELNDDVLFGEVWSRVDKLDLKTRCIVTLVCLLAKGITDNSLKYHIDNAKRHGVSKVEMVEIITHAAFYLGWPNAWAVFPLVRAAYAEGKAGFEPMFGLGEPNEEFAQHFDGQSYLNRLMKAESGSMTSPSLRAAVTTGTSIAPSKAGDRSF